MPLPNGATFAGFRIVRLLGSGGMGEVHLAQHPRLPKQIALKILPTATSSDTEFRERFGREADLAATLYHPHIVGVHDRGEYNGQLWIAMDFVDGADASRLLTDRYPAGMPVEQVLPIVTAVASALDYAHRRGMLHRDVKPANIMLTDDHEGEQRVLLADFGIARNLDDISGLTATNMTVGTVAYAAPEQLMGEAINGRADQYALGATAYHLLTGAQLFPHSNPAVVISRHLNASIPALADAQPGLATLDPVLAVALSKHQEDRFASCVDFARALSDHAAPSLAGATSQDLTRPAPSPRTQSAPADADAATAARKLHRPAPSGPASSTAPTPEKMAGAGLRRGRIPLVLPVLLVAIAVVLLSGGLALWHPWANRNDPVAEGGLAPDDAPATSPLTSSSAAPPPVPTTSTPPPPPTPTTTTTTPPTTQTDGAEAQQDDWREHNTWVCDTATGEVCGDWTPEEVTFACKAVFSGADYTAGLKSILMSRYGMGDTDAFFLGKEAMYSVSSGGYINSGSMADGPHPLCNGIVP